MAKREAKESPETQGRVSHVKDNRIGRLGWKGQVASVEDFVLNACAVELGLEVPGHHQAMTPQAPKYRTTGLDLTGEECNALVAYVKSLPKPAENRPASAEESKVHGAGQATFASIGCANCHAAKVGNVVGIYSDLLIHDMGQDLGDDGSYSESSDGDDEPLVPRFSVADGQPVQQPQPAANRVPKGATRHGMADATAVGLPRLRSVSPRWPGSDAGTGRGHARRPGTSLGGEVLRAFTPRASPGRVVPQVTGGAAIQPSRESLTET